MAGSPRTRRVVTPAPVVVHTVVQNDAPEGPPAKSTKGFVVHKGPGSMDEPLGGRKFQGIKLGQVCACGASFLVWLALYHSGEAFACPSCGATMKGSDPDRATERAA